MMKKDETNFSTTCKIKKDHARVPDQEKNIRRKKGLKEEKIQRQKKTCPIR
jgi:hypothetical protein